MQLNGWQNAMDNCCNNQSIFNSDYKKDGLNIQNRHCSNCKTHWHNGIKYTSKEWDCFLQSEYEKQNPIKYKLMKYWDDDYVMPQIKWAHINETN